MPTAEQLAESVLLDNRGIHVLLWSDQDDLYRALVIMLAVFDKFPIKPLLITTTDQSISELRQIFEYMPPSEEITDIELAEPVRNELLIFFIQQATSKSIGPWLNGWRSRLAASPGTILVVRHDDFIDFQRNAPDLSSFIGSKIFNASSMLSIWNQKTGEKMKANLPHSLIEILRDLPGQIPTKKEIAEWIEYHSPMND